LRWRRITLNALPGLHRVRFVSNNVGFVAGDGTEQYPTGVFKTADAGRTWAPVPGPPCPGWLWAYFLDEKTGAFAATWNRLAMLSGGSVAKVDLDSRGGRILRAVHLAGKRGVAVGQGGLVLINEDPPGPIWGIVDLGLPLAVRASWDFHAVAQVGDHLWVA